MSNQPTPARPWFRLTSIARPGPAPTPAPAPVPVQTLAPDPAPVQQRPPLVRPTFRPMAPLPTQPTQRQEPTPPPPATAPPPPPAPVIVAPLAPAAPTVVAPTPTPASTNGVASVPTSPTPRTSATTASLPNSPAPKTSPTPTPLPVTTTTTFSVPSSPKPRVLAPSSSVPTSPAPKAAAPSTSSVQTYPAPKTVSASPAKTLPTSTSVTTSPIARAPATTTAATTTMPAFMTRVTSPPKPIKPVAQTPPASPKPKITAPPPSPLNLPPPQIKSEADNQPKIPLEVEQKTVLVQKSIEKPKAWLNGNDSHIKPGIAHNVKKDVETKEKGHHKKFSSSDSEEAGMRVITVAGENKGAFMEVFQSPKKHGFEGNPHSLHKKGNPKTSDGSEWHSFSSSSCDEGSSKMKDNSNNKGKATPSLPMSAFMNSNVQGVNNSIVYNSTCTHHDPGVHVALKGKPGGGFQVKDHGNNGHQ